MRFLVLAGLLAISGLGIAADDKIPSIEYGTKRESANWVDTADGRVAVDSGIEWQGVKVYLSLTGDLVAVDAKTNKTLWSKMVAALWTRMTFKEVDSDGKNVWAVELKPSARESDSKDLIAHYELATGNEIKQKVIPPSGQAFKPSHVWSGSASRLGRPFVAFISTPENWAEFQKRMFGDKNTLIGEVPKDRPAVPQFAQIDFSKEVVLVVSSGSAVNSWGTGVESAYEDEQRVLVRLQRHSFQSGPTGISVRPYGIIVLPKRESKAYVLETNTQSYIGAPPVWKEYKKFPNLPDAKTELENVPDGC